MLRQRLLRRHDLVCAVLAHGCHPFMASPLQRRLMGMVNPVRADVATEAGRTCELAKEAIG